MKHLRIIKIEKEIEFFKVKQVLESNDIPVTSEKTENSAFPVLDKSAYHLVIPEEFSREYFRLIENDYPNYIYTVERTEKRPKAKRWLFLMIGYGVIMSMLFLKYYDINRKNSFDKNFIYQWNSINTELRLVNKRSQNLSAVFIDKNSDLNYEKTLSYSHGKVVSEAIDKDENGVYEEQLFFDLEGNYSGKSVDRNQDGLFEIMTMLLENEEEIVFVDTNKNGLFEIQQ